MLHVMFFDNFTIMTVYRYELPLEWKRLNDVINDVIMTFHGSAGVDADLDTR